MTKISSAPFPIPGLRVLWWRRDEERRLRVRGDTSRRPLRAGVETILLVTYRATDFLTFNALYAHAFGQGVINANFEGRGANYGFLETVVSF